jgi:hypothetical protein
MKKNLALLIVFLSCAVYSDNLSPQLEITGGVVGNDSVELVIKNKFDAGMTFTNIKIIPSGQQACYNNNNVIYIPADESRVIVSLKKESLKKCLSSIPQGHSLVGITFNNQNYGSINSKSALFNYSFILGVNKTVGSAVVGLLYK